MSYRPVEFEELGIVARWLDAEHAKNAHEFALRFAHPKRYGLNEESVEDIQRLEIVNYPQAKRWLADRFRADGTVQIVYGNDEVCVIQASSFVERWDEIFRPSRDDAVVLHNLCNEVGFYFHEEELEFGVRKSPTVQSTRIR